MAKILIIKNQSGGAKTYAGQEIADAAQFNVPVEDQERFSRALNLITDIIAEDAVINDGLADIADANTAIDYLKGNIAGEVVTQNEKDNKTLRTFCVFATTDEEGNAEICIPIPENGRWIAYGDAEFKIRHFGDYVSVLEVTDLDRVIAWQIALAADPNAVAPVSDATVIGMGASVPGGPFPLYPVLGHYDERSFPDPIPPNAVGTIHGGMAMTFQWGSTEAQPVGGYAWVPGLMYFRIVATKSDEVAAPDRDGYKCQFSIDWAEPK